MSENTADKGDMIVDGLGHVEDQAGAPNVAPEPKHAAPEPEQEDTFDRAYVEELRKENAKYRTRANAADTLAQRLHTALVAADGRLQDATDLEFNPEHLDSEKALEDAITALLEAKPHLRARKAAGDIGAGDRGEAHNDTDLIGIIRALS